MDAQIRQCNVCNKIFHSFSGSRTCPECLQKMDDDFIAVRDYLEKFPHATIQEVAKKTDVKEGDILRMLKEGRLILHSATGILLCERCDKPIHSGTLCDDCKNALSQTLSSAIEPGNARVAQDRQSAAREKTDDEILAAKKQQRMHVDVKRDNRKS
ncbi:hypothetical protein LJC55_03115 [Eubacteriales bacterium OttesenSCG-928-N14]|nr:hypothetical protein [Eubacteriales bacterium OttesenSCG-928-N14]